jgi:phosphoesterase RecJ-like protein
MGLSLGKQVRIINSSPVPESFRFMDTNNKIESWDTAGKTIAAETAFVIVDSTDANTIGKLKELIPHVSEVFVIDHHDINQASPFSGHIDSTASSTCEIVLESAMNAGIRLPPDYAMAAYAGLVYDTGFFAHKKTTRRTFKTALALTEAGVNPHEMYKTMNQNIPTGALLLEKAVMGTLEIKNNGRVAVQVLMQADLESTGANYEDAEDFVNIPLKSREIEVSILVKQFTDGQIRCSLRSKGAVNVAEVAESLGGGGHITSAGFRSPKGIKETIDMVLKKVSEALDKK